MSSGQNEISLQAGVDDLADDVLVGETNNKAVFRRVAVQEISTFKKPYVRSTHYLFLA